MGCGEQIPYAVRNLNNPRFAWFDFGYQSYCFDKNWLKLISICTIKCFIGGAEGLSGLIPSPHFLLPSAFDSVP